MDSHEASKENNPDPPVRTLKIEEHGNHFRGRIKPKIRLIGHWLERAGFKPGARVSVTCLGSGVIELRCEISRMNESKQASSGGLDCAS